MSKSLGNVISLEEATSGWGRGAMRLWYLSAHHRSPLTFEDAYLDEARTVHERFATFLRTADLIVGEDVEPDPAAAEAHRDAFRAAMDDDLNAPKAVAALHDLVSEGFEVLKKAEAGDDGAKAAARALADTLIELGDDVLGLDLADTLARSRAIADRLRPVVESLIAERREAREAKDFATADRVRDLLTAIGVVVEDRPGGSRWYVEDTTSDVDGR